MAKLNPPPHTDTLPSEAKAATQAVIPNQVVTLGCRLNHYESDAMAEHMRLAGLENTVIVNSCAVTNEAVRQTRQTIRKAKRDRPDARILVTGCASQITPETFNAMPEVDQVIGNSEKMRLDTYRKLASADKAATHHMPDANSLEDIMQVRDIPAPPVSRSSGKARAFVQVQNGCDHRCTFCIIPFGRGNARSKPIAQVISEVTQLLKAGHFEIVLTGVDMTSWGVDLEGQPQLGDLVKALLLACPDLPRLRLSSIDAIEIDPVLMEVIAQEPRFAPYLHLSLQSGDAMILKRMKRRHSPEQAIALCQQLKVLRPDLALGADFIAGFPTETEAMFQNTLHMVEACDLAFLHIFPFSPRPGTPAAKMPQLDKAIISERAKRLREKGEAALAKHFKKHIGQKRKALIETTNMARLADFTPVDLRVPVSKSQGEHWVEITGYRGQKLVGDLIGT